MTRAALAVLPVEVQNIRLARSRRRVSLTQLAHVMELEHGALLRRLRGATRFTIDDIRRAAVVLRYAPGDLAFMDPEVFRGKGS